MSAFLPHPSPPPVALPERCARCLLCGRVYQAENSQRIQANQLKDGLPPYQISLLEKVRKANSDPIVKYPRASQRTLAQQAASEEIHKRVNPGYCDMPYQSSNARDFKYMLPPDFTREYLKADSDCQFQKFAARPHVESATPP